MNIKKNCHREADHVGAVRVLVLVPCIVTCVGGFTPRDTTYDAGGILDPKDSLSCLFRQDPPLSAAHHVEVNKVSFDQSQ